MKEILFFGITLLSIQICTAMPSYSAMTNEDILKRIEELSTTINKQQEEIEQLKQELEKQNRKTYDTIDEQKNESSGRDGKSEDVKWHDYIPEWVRRIQVSGDLRLRYEGRFNRGRVADGYISDLPDRHLYRLRARLFFDGHITDGLSAHLMICTNQDENKEATTTNQSFNDDFSDKGIYLHRAYATYKPAWLKGLEITAGKFKNTFFYTDIIFDPDVNPEGINEKFSYLRWESFTPFIHLGQMVLNEENLETDDAALYIYQAGFVWKIGPVKWALAGSYYDWSNLQSSEFLHTSSYKGGGGNTFILDEDGILQYQYDYELWEGITSLSFSIGPIPINIIFDYVINMADDVPRDEDSAFFIGLKLGREELRGDYSIFYKYAHIEKNAVVGSLNDQDFYGANRKGHKLTFNYMIFKRLKVGISYFHTKPESKWDINSITYEKNKDRQREDRLQGDFIFKF